jgi:hypothetical protein
MSFDQYLNRLKQVLESLLEYIGSRCLPIVLPSTNEQQLVEEKKGSRDKE